jgi:hypothetical protein
MAGVWMVWPPNAVACSSTGGARVGEPAVFRFRPLMAGDGRMDRDWKSGELLARVSSGARLDAGLARAAGAAMGGGAECLGAG